MLKYLYWLLPVGWMGVIFYSSAQPYENQDVKPLLASKFDLSFLTPYLNWIVITYHNSEVSVRALGIEGFVEFFMRKGAHLGVFFILMCLVVLAFKKTSRIKWGATLAVSFLLTVTYAAVDEFHQSFTANRTPYVGDVLLDGAGALIALILVFFFYRYWTKKQRT